MWESDNATVALSSRVWAKGEPNNSGEGGKEEDCVEMRFDGKLNDKSCDVNMGIPVCQKQLDRC